MKAAMKDERGFALLAVMLVLALLGVVVTEFTFSMRLEASMVRSFKESVLGRYLAEAATQQAMRELLSPADVHGFDETGDLAFFRIPAGGTQPTRLPSLPRVRVPLGAGEFTYRITDEEARVNINTAAPDRVDRLLSALGIEKRDRDIINDSLQDWKDSDSLSRPNGAESEDYYLRLPVPYRARNTQIQDVRELLQIRGITPEVYWGTPGKPGLADFVTVVSRDTVNMNTASVPVLKALGLSDAEISDITQARVRAPYPAVPGRFAGRGLTVGSSTFRVEADGLFAGQPKTRVVAIVQRRAAVPSTGRSQGSNQPGAQPSQGGAGAPTSTPPAGVRSSGQPGTQSGTQPGAQPGTQPGAKTQGGSSDLGAVILSWRVVANPS
jgi:general secretion pathway protein K